MAAGPERLTFLKITVQMPGELNAMTRTIEFTFDVTFVLPRLRTSPLRPCHNRLIGILHSPIQACQSIRSDGDTRRAPNSRPVLNQALIFCRLLDRPLYQPL